MSTKTMEQNTPAVKPSKKATNTSASKIRTLTATAILGAVAGVIQFLEFAVPLMPGFIKMDLSDFPALIASFALGPVSGVSVALIKNLIKLLTTTTAGVGELSNFILSALFVLPAGLIYKHKKTRSGAVLGAIVGACTMAILSYFTNYYFVYPVFTKFMPMEAIIKAYTIILPSVNTLSKALLIFNVPFTFVKGLLNVLVTFLLYKPLSPILKGKKR